MNINFRVEYEAVPIRHVAVQCPYCDKWFVGYDVLQDGELRYKHNLDFARFSCPVCGRDFSGYNPDSGFETVKVEECDNHMEVYKDCLRRKTVWE